MMSRGLEMDVVLSIFLRKRGHPFSAFEPLQEPLIVLLQPCFLVLEAGLDILQWVYVRPGVLQNGQLRCFLIVLNRRYRFMYQREHLLQTIPPHSLHIVVQAPPFTFLVVISVLPRWRGILPPLCSLMVLNAAGATRRSEVGCLIGLPGFSPFCGIRARRSTTRSAGGGAVVFVRVLVCATNCIALRLWNVVWRRLWDVVLRRLWDVLRRLCGVVLCRLWVVLLCYLSLVRHHVDLLICNKIDE